jgi:hypothetical protein
MEPVDNIGPELMDPEDNIDPVVRTPDIAISPEIAILSAVKLVSFVNEI